MAMVLMGINLFAAKVSKNEAEIVARNYYFQQHNLFKGELKFQDIQFLDVIEEKRNGEVALYVFTLNNGYVIISAENAMIPVIGYSWESPYPKEKEAHFAWFISEFINNIEYLREYALAPDFEILNLWNQYSTGNYSELLSVKEVRDVPVLVSATWNQDWPYNYYAPEDEASPANGHTYAGCVATAMSMIMYYWQYPETGTGSRQYYQYPYGVLSADFENTEYQWEAMLDNVSAGSHQDAIKAIAELQYHCGIAVHMTYGPDGSGAYSPDVPAALENYLRYEDAVYQAKSGMTNAQWETLLVGQLDAGQPMYHSGTEPPSYGHAFVVDGYTYSGTTYMFHFNFGWGGYGNGYFASTDAGGYTLNHAIVKDFIPTQQYPFYAQGATTLTHKVGRFTDGSGPLENYLDNTSASWLIQPQSVNDSITGITLFIDNFEIDGSDVLRIYDGSDASAPLLAEYTGNDTPATQYSTGNTLFVTFDTDDSGNAPGFLMRYTTSLYAWCSGTTTFTEATGTFDDGSGDKNYNPGTLCRFKIIPEYASAVTLYFDSFETADENDYMEIYDWNSSTLLATLTGNVIPEPVTSPSGKMYIIWRSDNFDEAAGWSAYWETENVGIQSITPEQITLYPNPANHSLHLAFQTTSVNPVILEIRSPEGKLVFSAQEKNSPGACNRTIDVSNFKQGIYFLRITNTLGSVTKKIIIE